MDITKLKHIHFTGIKGVGMTALALCSQDLGIKITGSDTEEVFVTDDALAKRNIKWQKGFSRKNLSPKPDLVITTGAHGGLNNPEVLEAKKMKIPVLTYAEGLARFANTKKLISVCGVGGKGTTASIIAVLSNEAVFHPSFAIGLGDILPLDVSGRYDRKGEYFICEADEYSISPGINDNPKFSLLNPFITVVTNIEHDHPDIYPTISDTLKTYRTFFQKIPKQGLLIANIDNINTKNALENLDVPIITYGFSKSADWVAETVIFGKEKTSFQVRAKNGESFTINIKLPGKYNVLNSLAAFIVSRQVGIPEDKIIKGLALYQGAKRRFEKIGVKNGVTFYDDYAHHPGEIKSVLAATRDWFPNERIIAIFQPHTYSRTKALLNEFSEAFKDADIVGFMDIYASARENKDESVSSEILTRRTKLHHDNVHYLGNHKKTFDWIKSTAKKGDIVLTMGAGDIFHLYKELNL